MSGPTPDAPAPAPAAGADPGNFFVRRPIVAMVISIVTVIVGLVSMSRLPIAQFPEMVPPMIKITGNYTGADALTVEQSVATPIEQQVNGVERMIYMQSTNSADGKMALNVSFEVGTNVNIAMPTLPPEVKQTGVSLKKSLAMPLLVVSVGIVVVDDAIVVVEAVEHHIHLGLDPKAATNKAMREVSGPVIAIALVLSAVFIPVAFVGSITGRMYQQFAITIALSVILSAINALTLSPALCGMLLKPKKEGTGLLAKFFALFNKGFNAVTERYGKWTAVLLRRGVLTVGLLLAFFGGAGALGSALPGGFVPEEDQGYLLSVLALPPASSLQRADEVAKQEEELLEKAEGVKTYNTMVGLSLATNTSSTYLVSFFVQLEDRGERVPHGHTARNIMLELNRELAKMPETAGFALGPPAIPGIGTGSGFSIFVQDMVGRDTDALAAQTQKFIEVAKKRPEFARVGTSWMAAGPQLYVDVDREKMMKQGVDPSELYCALQTYMGSSYINDFNRFGRQWRVYLAAEPEYRASVQNIGDFYVRNREGHMVPVSSVATVRTINGPEYTTRFNLYRSVEVTGEPAPGVSSGQAMKALEEVAKETLEEGYRTAWNAMSYQEATAPSSSTASTSTSSGRSASSCWSASRRRTPSWWWSSPRCRWTRASRCSKRRWRAPSCACGRF